MKETFVELDGARIRYIEDGSGRPVLILHGASFNAEVWVKTGTLNAISSIGWRAIAVDMPGFGKSEKGEFGTMSAFISKFANALGLNEFVIMGASLGGKEALEYSVLNPDRIIGLILIGAVGVWMYESRLNTISDKPALLIWGAEDSISPKENYSILLKNLRNAKLKIIGKIHPCYLEEPEKFNAAVQEFLASL